MNNHTCILIIDFEGYTLVKLSKLYLVPWEQSCQSTGLLALVQIFGFEFDASSIEPFLEADAYVSLITVVIYVLLHDVMCDEVNN